MPTFGYIRTSRDQDPGHPGSDPEIQRRQLADAGVEPEQIYANVAVSGATPGSSRAQWHLLHQQLARGDVLVMAAVDRLGRREEYEYQREGTHNMFLACEPLAGWQHVAVMERRTTEDFARQMRWLVDKAYPGVPVIRLVLENLNTHRKGSLYQTFQAEEARRIARKLEFHYTPKHGSWLNMAEIEFSVFSRSCLRQRLPD